jgi:hypothetical protein
LLYKIQPTKGDVIMASKISGRSLALEIARGLGASEELIAHIKFAACWQVIIKRCLQNDREMAIRILNRMVIYNTDPVFRNYIHRGVLGCEDLPESVLVLLLSEKPDWNVFWLVMKHNNTPIYAIEECARDEDPDKRREAIEALRRRGRFNPLALF